LLDIKDRVIIRGEFYYNHAGYSYNVFEAQQSCLTLLEAGLFEPNHVSRYYASFFTTIQRCILSDAVFSLNAISNLADGSGTVYTAFSYTPWYDFSIDFSASFAVGDGKDEYTFMGNDKMFGLEFRYNF
jgi:hypothetical protein